MLKTGNNVSQGTNVLDTGGELLTVVLCGLSNIMQYCDIEPEPEPSNCL